MKLACASPHAVGLGYELLVVKTLERWAFSLAHTGGRGDRGADFTGHWVLPTRRAPVIGQCKCHSKSIGPGSVREFESVLLRQPQSYGMACTGVLVSHSWFSPSALKLFRSSRCPLILCQVVAGGTTPSNNGEGGVLKECALNRVAKSALPEVAITTKLALTSSNEYDGLERKTIAILVRDSEGRTQSLASSKSKHQNTKTCTV